MEVKLPNEDYTLKGSVVASGNRWCFKIKEGTRVAYYNEKGLVTSKISKEGYSGDGSSLGFSACIDGVTYGSDGKVQ